MYRLKRGGLVCCTHRGQWEFEKCHPLLFVIRGCRNRWDFYVPELVLVKTQLGWILMRIRGRGVLGACSASTDGVSWEKIILELIEKTHRETLSAGLLLAR
jgi:hypothetical protein